jgi:ferrochelatase
MRTVPGILLSNLGTPEAPTPAALRPFLRQFLSDSRVVEAPRPLWWLILNLVILPLRPRRSARLYAKIWTAEGSPLMTISVRQAEKLARHLENRIGRSVPVALGMRYGRPSVTQGIDALIAAGCDRVLVLPLYPQYSGATVGTTFDAAVAAVSGRRVVPELRTVHGYHDHPDYIRALGASIRQWWQEYGRADHLLFSFHGIPAAYADAGDPYPQQCACTARLVAEELALAPGRWSMAYQSRFGRERWLEPYTDEEIVRLAHQEVSSLEVACPGFAADGLETLEEIEIAGAKIFEANGGHRYRYIPALNDRPDHIAAVAEIAIDNLGGWM